MVADGTPVPGNVGLSDESRSLRIERWFRPYHDAIESVLLERMARGAESILIAIHSMAPDLDGRSRPWQIAVSSHQDRRLSNLLLSALRSRGDLIVGDNEPYCIDPAIDYSIPFHALSRGLLHAQMEFRQDEIADTAAAQRWAARFAEALIGAVRQLPS
jgi:predicted N-formylglutamate amidohydrolase